VSFKFGGVEKTYCFLLFVFIVVCIKILNFKRTNSMLDPRHGPTVELTHVGSST
jgi:hypothetical protein